MPVNEEEIQHIAKLAAEKVISKKSIGCTEAKQLAQIIDHTAQIEDLLTQEGAEQDIRDSATLPVPGYLPQLAELVDDFNNELARIPKKLSSQQAKALYATSQNIRAATTPYLLSAVTRCIIAPAE